MAQTFDRERLRRLRDLVRGSLEAPEAPDADTWEQWTAAVTERVERAWPNLLLDLEGFFAHVGRLLAAERTGLEPSSTRAYEDLYLAFACGSGDPKALQVFQREYATEFAAAVAQMRLTPAQAEDARQRLWEKLFVRKDNLPRILEYSGRGALRQWFRVVAIRSLLDEPRSAGKEEPLDREWVMEIPSPADDPEVQYLKQLYGLEFRRAFEEAALALSPEDRNTLRSYYAEKMSIDAMALAFGIHRATAARRVERARENLVQATRARLAERLALSAQALESVIRMIESHLHLSVRRVLCCAGRGENG